MVLHRHNFIFTPSSEWKCQNKAVYSKGKSGANMHMGFMRYLFKPLWGVKTVLLWGSYEHLSITPCPFCQGGATKPGGESVTRRDQPVCFSLFVKCKMVTWRSVIHFLWRTNFLWQRAGRKGFNNSLSFPVGEQPCNLPRDVEYPS